MYIVQCSNCSKTKVSKGNTIETIKCIVTIAGKGSSVNIVCNKLRHRFIEELIAVVLCLKTPIANHLDEKSMLCNFLGQRLL